MKKLVHLIVTVFMISIMSISSFASDMYVYDESGLLAAEELIALDTRAAEVSDEHDCGIYMIAVNNYHDYSTSDIYTTATELYHGLDLGEGEDREGVLLLLSLYDRSYATFFYGENVEYAFDGYGQEQMEGEFLDDFGNNDWYSGFNDYISVCDEYLTLAEEGSPVRESVGHLYLIAFGASILIAYVVMAGLKSSMKSVRKGSIANAYVTEEGLNLTEKRDHFLYKTQTRRKIEKSSGKSGSKSHSGGGGSGRSGKF
ncbi:MAG: TPM domain-containing protein [Lachnospiraceae bacterium]|nr:TPM domain-containing protein [Lachnospiraceae bacterium]